MDVETQQSVFYKGKINCIDNNNIGKKKLILSNQTTIQII